MSPDGRPSPDSNDRSPLPMGARLASTEARLARLEEENRRLRTGLRWLAGTAAFGIVLCMSLLACAGGRQTAGAPSTLQARRIEIVNEKGTPVVVLQADSRGWGHIVTSDDAGVQLVQIAATDEGGTLAATDRRGQIRAAMGITKEDAGSVFTFDTNGKRLLALGIAGSGDGALFSYLRNGQLKQMWP